MSLSTNWNDLTKNLKHKCIARMDFKTRFLFRCTSRAERILVDKHKFHFKRVIIEEYDGISLGSVILVSRNFSTIHMECPTLNVCKTSVVPLLKYVKRYGIIDELIVDVDLDKTLKKKFIEEIFNLPPEPEKTNWKHLSVEMMLEVIKKMDFKSRLQFRQTGRLERILVDSLRVNFDFLRIKGLSSIGLSSATELSFRVFPNRETVIKFRNPREFKSKVLPFLKYILKIGVIEVFHSKYAEQYIDEMVNGYSEDNKFKKFLIKSLECEMTRRSMFFLVRYCDEKVLESIKFNAIRYKKFPIDRLLTFPAVFMARKIQINNCSDINILCNIVEKWLKIDAPIGSSVTFHGNGSIDMFHDRFQKRFIPFTPYYYPRLRTNNPLKQIVVKIENQNGYGHVDVLTCTIVKARYIFPFCFKICEILEQ